MPTYWCRFLDGRGRVISSEKMISASDDEVIAKMQAIVLAEHRNGFEIWEGDRLVEVENARELC